jgi:Na+-transporting methylmalonyl-CoA/oxaloacetate decarboxylase beta subunit
MKKITKLRMAKYGTIVSGIISLLILSFDGLTMFILKIITGTTPNMNHSYVIIGGADGPTAIFITSRYVPDLKIIITSIFLITCIVCAFIWRKLSKCI